MSKQSEEYQNFRHWVLRRRNEIPNGSPLTLENLFAMLMYAVSTIGKEPPSGSILDIKDKVTNKCWTDATYFEVACYTYYLIDLWLFNNKPNLRATVSKPILHNLDMLFDKVLQINISPIIDRRIDKYAEMTRKRTTPKECHDYLTELILNAASNGLPYALDSDVPLKLVFFGDVYVKVALGEYVIHMVPEAIRLVNQYCALLEKMERD